jgi:putative chitinase
MPIIVDQLRAIINPVRYDDSRIQSIVNALNDTFEKYSIDSNIRMCHFLAQVLHESGAFRYSSEIWGNTPAQQAYDTRIDLGNTPEHDGDGYKYRGRGWIQLTGKTNYRLFGKEVGLDLLTDPDKVAEEPYDSLAAGWYWNRKDLNSFADQDDILTITKKINGGFNGLDDRKMWHIKARVTLPY